MVDTTSFELSILRYNIYYDFKLWDARFTVPLLEFRFEFVLPKMRKERFIALRDSLGRIIKSIVPQNNLGYNEYYG